MESASVERPTSDLNYGPPRWPGDTRPPFAPGNTLSTQHGAESPRKVEPIAAVFATTLADDAPWTASPAFTGTVRSWAHSEAQAQLLRAFIDDHGMFDDEGQDRPAVRVLDRVEGRLAKLRDQLGLNPMALGKLLAAASTVARATSDEGAVKALAAEGAAIFAARTKTQPTTGQEATR